MAKVTRKGITRGVELTPEIVTDPLTAMKTEIEGVNIEGEQIEGKYTTFRMNFNIPWLDSKYFFDNAEIDQEDPIAADAADCNAPYYIPFCLPPLQEDFDADKPSVSFGQPVPILDEIGLSFDQQDEATTLVSQWYGKRTGILSSSTTPALQAGASNGYQHQFSDLTPGPGGPNVETSPEYYAWCPHTGKKSYERLDAYDFRIDIYEKPQAYWSPGEAWSDQAKERNQVVSAAFPATNYAGVSRRLNPVSFSGLNKQLSPYKTYILALYAPNLHDSDTARRMHALVPSLNISLRFLMRPYSRDRNAGGSDIQNMPTAHAGAKVGPTVTVTPPVAGDNITADSDAKGVSTNIQAIDQKFADKLRGGYQDFSMAYPTEELKEDAGYEVLTVPMGQGFVLNRMSIRDDFPWAPYTQNMNIAGAAKTVGDYPNPGAVGQEQAYIDRRLIPLPHSMTIHHVLFVLNYTSDRLQHPAWTQAMRALYGAAADPTIGQTQYINATLPGDGKMSYEVGVGLVTGVPGDNFDYQQVAYMRRNSSSSAGLPGVTDAQIVDSVNLDLPGCGYISAASPSTTKAQFEQQILSVPLVDGAGLGAGKGYYSDATVTTPGVGTRGDQGPPVFVGEGNTYTAARSDVGSTGGGAAAAPSTAGAEQYLEVRLGVRTTAAAPGNNVLVPVTVGPTNYLTYNTTDYGWGDIALGYGGCWVYIIGKKHLK